FGAVVIYTASAERVREGEKLRNTGTPAKAESMAGMKDCKMMKAGMDCDMMGGTKTVAPASAKPGDKGTDVPKGHEGHH
ncbi:MAG: hypothetical protein JWN25_1338, partial [Verrucomicrobiales bacterium]|nr:hypothetical protein [Verrucomicrobiales bacterium]